MATDQCAHARLHELRELLPATGAGIYLDTATRGPLPAETYAAMRQADEWELRVGRVSAGREQDVAQRAAEARAVVAALLGGDPDAIVLSHGHADALQLARQLLGDDAAVIELVDSATGELADVHAPRSAGSPLVVDATNAAGAIALAVDELGADAVVVAGDRWLLGPEATAALWLRQPPAPRHAIERSLPRSALVGLARSVGWLEMYVGLEWIHARTARLAARLHGALAALPGVELATAQPPNGPIVSFALAGWSVEEAADELGRRVFALLRPLPERGLLRASVAWFNTDEELDRFAATVGLLAEHTPATLPQRPSLTVL